MIMSHANQFQETHTMRGRLSQISPQQLVTLINGICEALEAAETTFHGDLNPCNISMDEAGVVALGPAIVEDHVRYSAEQIEYIAPEVFWRDERSQQADVYSIGMLMYTWANGGCLPFLYPDAGATDRAEALRRRMSGEGFEFSSVSPELNKIIKKATAFKPDKRYASVADLREAFQAFAEKAETDSAAMVEARDALIVQKQQEAAMMANILAAAEAAAATAGSNVPKATPKKRQKPAEPIKKEEEKKKMSLRPLVAVLLIAAILMVAAVAMQFGADNTTLSNPSGSTAPSETPVIPTADPSASPDIIIPGVSASPDVPTTDNPLLTPSPSPSPASIVTIDTSRYSVVKSDAAWSTAAENCINSGGYLATINSQDEFSGLCALAEKYGLEKVWIGGFRKSGNIVWINGETTEFMAWASGEPSYRDTNGAQENFLMLVKTDGVWGYNDVIDDPAAAYADIYSGKMGYIMEK